MNNKFLICSLTGALLATASLVEAQQTKLPRVGFLIGGSSSSESLRIEAFRRGLSELGYVEGKNITIEYRYAEGNIERLPKLAAELVRLNVDMIVAPGPASRAAKNATGTIPVVVTNVGDPVGTGLVASLAQPGGNVTGLSSLTPDLGGKQLEILKEAFPATSRVAVFWTRGVGANTRWLEETKIIADQIGVRLQPVELRSADEFEVAFSAIKKDRASALIVLRNPLTTTHQSRTVELAAKSRLPAMYYDREFVDSGGLMSYGPNFSDLFRRAATYVDKILKGAKPAELPVEQPTKFELVINLKTANQIGLTIPPNVLAQADKVIK
jgi:putative ABC transport system substrate-binding protein